MQHEEIRDKYYNFLVAFKIEISLHFAIVREILPLSMQRTLYSIYPEFHCYP